MARPLVVLLAVLAFVSERGTAQDPQVRNALLVQVDGWGGCTDLTAVRSVSIRFFPKVHFYEGACTFEHGDPARPLAAEDSAGLVYVLNSESSFHFLVLQHPPVGLDSSTVVEYVELALRMQGKVPFSAQVLRDRADAPTDLCRNTGLVCSGLFLTRAGPGGRSVFFTAHTAFAIYSAGPIAVELKSGQVFALVSVSYDTVRTRP